MVVKPKRVSAARVRTFRAKVYRHFEEHGRRLPWRTTRNPYFILVSEIMLQQTQVDRVRGYYHTFIRRFPTPRALASAPLADVLRVWRGLGYNRRAKFLRDAACAIVARHGGRVPRDLAALRALPGVGPYTAGAIRAFAWNEAAPVIETNIRNVFTHEFFSRKKKVRDAEIMPLIEASLDRKRPRRWYAALMDYGVALKKTEKHLNARSAHYVRQKPFRGSARELRGKVLVLLTHERRSLAEETLARRVGVRAERVRGAVRSLARDGLVAVRRGRVALA